MTNLMRAALKRPWPVHWFDVLESTQLEALQRAQARQQCKPCWIIAQHQTKGRGRRGRIWCPADGNLYASALFPFDLSLTLAPSLGAVVGLAAHEAVVASLGHSWCDAGEIRLKWPNDIRWQGHKLGGVIVETGENDTGRWAVAGIGINVISVPATDQPAASLSQLGCAGKPTVRLVLSCLQHALFRRLRRFASGEDGEQDIGREWRAVCEKPDDIWQRSSAWEHHSASAMPPERSADSGVSNAAGKCGVSSAAGRRGVSARESSVVD